jgi:serpin B
MKKLFLTLLLFSQLCADQFALDLYSKLRGTEGNLAFSPYGIYSNLSLLYYGAEGETAEQIKNVLHLSGDAKSFHRQLTGLTHKTKQGYQLYIANALFPYQGTHLLPAFEKIASQNFEAELHPVNFGEPSKAADLINSWISEKTEKKIPHMLQEGDIDTSTRLVLANAVYFNGKWTSPFSPKATKPGLFHVGDETLEVDMLSQTSSFSYFENEELQALSLPFIRQGTEQPLLKCVILLPRENESNLSLENLDTWLQNAKPADVNVQVPKFCIRKQIGLNQPLKELGMSTAFSYGADFSKINGGKDLFLSSVLHETYFSFKENGVTAASATTSQLSLKSIYIPPEKVIPFIADHPFLFMIIDSHSQAILFMGRVTKPEKCHEN